MPFVPKGSISDQQLSSVNATEGRTVRVYSAGVSETLSAYLNDLSSRLRAQDDRIASMEREIEQSARVAFRAGYASYNDHDLEQDVDAEFEKWKQQ